MKTIGLVGGIIWHSAQEYYRIINEEVNRRLGKLHSDDQDFIHHSIYEELALGIIKSATRQRYQKIMHGLQKTGCQGFTFRARLN